MSTFLIIIAAIIVVGLLAYLIVNKIPKGARPVISILLWLLIGFLGYSIFQSIMGPIKFNKAKVTRYEKVIKKLKMIRDAEVAHKEVTGRFSKDKEGLIKFLDTAKFAVTEVKNIVVQEDKGGGIIIPVEKRIVDTIGFKDVRASFAGRDYNNMFKVPGTKEAEFSLKVGLIDKLEGIKASVFEAKVDKEVVLKGLNKDLIRQERESLGGAEVKGEFISVGSLEDVKVSGNWPPSYDTTKEKDQNK